MDSGLSNTQKIQVFTYSGSFKIGNKTTDYTTNDSVRITIHTGCGVYCKSEFLVIRHYFPGAVELKIEKTSFADQSTYVEHSVINCSGNPGYRVIPLSAFLFGNNGIHDLRITATYIGPSYPTTPHSIGEIKLYASNVYQYPSNYAKTGHLYGIDAEQNATFPANVTASKIIKSGGTSSQFLKADGSVDSNSYATTSALSAKQDALVSGTNIKTINGTSILGSGNISISGTGGGEANVIETVKVNGTALTPDSNKAVDVTVPTKVSDLTDDVVSGSYLPLTGGNMNSGALIRLRNSSFSMVLQPFGIVKESNEQSHALYLPDASGTIALTSDIPTIESLTTSEIDTI